MCLPVKLRRGPGTNSNPFGPSRPNRTSAGQVLARLIAALRSLGHQTPSATDQPASHSPDQSVQGSDDSESESEPINVQLPRKRKLETIKFGLNNNSLEIKTHDPEPYRQAMNLIMLIATETPLDEAKFAKLIGANPSSLKPFNNLLNAQKEGQTRNLRSFLIQYYPENFSKARLALEFAEVAGKALQEYLDHSGNP